MQTGMMMEKNGFIASRTERQALLAEFNKPCQCRTVSQYDSLPEGIFSELYPFATETMPLGYQNIDGITTKRNFFEAPRCVKSGRRRAATPEKETPLAYFPTGECGVGGQYWTRTSDPYHVKVVL